MCEYVCVCVFCFIVVVFVLKEVFRVDLGEK